MPFIEKKAEMDYELTTYGLWNNKNWVESSKRNTILTESMSSFKCLDESSFKTILKDELDVPDYKVDKKSILKEFGYDKHSEIKVPDECIQQIIKYYTWRKALHGKICKSIANAKKLMSNSNADKLALKFYIPAECNNFSFEEPHYTAGQVEAWIEVVLTN